MKKRIFVLLMIVTICCYFPPPTIQAAEVAEATARLVAENFLQHHLTSYGAWGGSNTPSIEGVEAILYQDATLGYNFSITPSGHILVPSQNEFSPVLLYSTTSSFLPSRVNQPYSIESWLLPEIHASRQILAQQRFAPGQEIAYAESSVAKAWDALTLPAETTPGTTRESSTRSAEVLPLLSTTWDQGSPYNQYTPGITGQCTHTLTGCIATAWAQLMKYWNWPPRGVGSQSYQWNNRILSANFNHDYYWANMPNQLTAASTTVQKDAVARLISDIGIAATLNYGCYGTGGTVWADQVLDTYFRYKTSMTNRSRGSYTDSQWFEFFKTELDAAPPRPVVLSIFSTSNFGHEVIADGYRSDMTGNSVHINLGWPGNYNGYYNIMQNFLAGYEWRADNQVIVTGIEPDLYGGALDCANAALLTPGVALSGNTSSGTSNVLAYSCLPYPDTGPEKMHKIYLPVPGTITAKLTGASSKLDVMLLNACDPASCLAHGTASSPLTYENAPAGLYYLVVDGYQNYKGAYTLTSTAPFGHDNWTTWMSGGIKTSSPVSMTVFDGGSGDRLYQAMRGYSNNQVWTRALTDAYNWQPWTSNLKKTTSAVTMQVFNHRLYQAIRGYGDNLIWTRSTPDGQAWTEWGGADSAMKTISNVTMQVFNNTLYQAVRQYSTNYILTRSSTDGVTWNARGGESTTKTASNVTMTVFGNRLYQAIRGYGNNYVWTRSTPDGVNWTAWEKFSNTLAVSDVTMAVFNNRLYQAIRQSGTNDALTRFMENGSAWTAWQKGTPKKTLSAIPMKEATINGTTRLYQAMRGTDGKAHTRYTLDGDNWTAWLTDGVTLGDVSIEAFDPGSGNRLYQAMRGSSYYVWNRFTTGLTMMSPAPAVASPFVNIRKSGAGNGIITVGTWVCPLSCQELQIPVLPGVTLSANATPADGSTFVGWQTSSGNALTGFEYVQPGETVFAVFE